MAQARPKVLIVDDSDANRLVLRRVAEELNAEVLEAADGLQGLDKAAHNDIALVLLDLQMPMMDGFEATRALRASPRTAHIPIIMITEVRVSLADQRTGLGLGAVAYLTRQNLDFVALKEQMRLLLDLYLRASDLQAQIHAFLDDSAKLAAQNENIGALQDGLHRHLLLDPLTSLPNRMYFDLHLDIALKRAVRGGRPFAVAWMSLDHLARINERHGRHIGDAILLAVGSRMEAIVRVSDVLARVAGDTYGIILDGVTRAGEATLALQKTVAACGEALEVLLPDSDILTIIPTLSVGVAIYPRHGKDRSSLIDMARKSAAEVVVNGGDGVRVGFGS